MFQLLQWACVAIFTVSVPPLVFARFRYSEFPVWHFILLAAVLGWVLANAHAGIQHLWVDAERQEEFAAFQEFIRHPPPPVTEPDDSVTTEGPGIGDFLWEEYQPIAAIVYGPAYFLCCWLAALALFRRCSPRLRRVILLVSIGVLLAVWTAIFGALIKIKPPDIFSDGVYIFGWNPFFGPQLTLPLAVLTAWLVVAWLPTAIAGILKRPIKSA